VGRRGGGGGVFTFLSALISHVDELGHRSWPELFEHLKVFLLTTIVVNKVAGLRVFMNAVEHQYTGVVQEITLTLADRLPCFPIQVRTKSSLENRCFKVGKDQCGAWAANGTT